MMSKVKKLKFSRKFRKGGVLLFFEILVIIVHKDDDCTTIRAVSLAPIASNSVLSEESFQSSTIPHDQSD